MKLLSFALVVQVLFAFVGVLPKEEKAVAIPADGSAFS